MLDLRVASTHGSEEIECFNTSATREKKSAEQIAVLTLQSATFLKPFHRVRIEHFAPDVRVIASRVARRKNVAEVRRPISRWYRRKIDSSLLQRFALELHHLFAGGDFVTTQLMPRLVQQRGRQIFCRRETLVELGGGLNLFYKRRRQRFARLVMAR